MLYWLVVLREFMNISLNRENIGSADTYLDQIYLQFEYRLVSMMGLTLVIPNDPKKLHSITPSSNAILDSYFIVIPAWLSNDLKTPFLQQEVKD